MHVSKLLAAPTIALLLNTQGLGATVTARFQTMDAVKNATEEGSPKAAKTIRENGYTVLNDISYLGNKRKEKMDLYMPDGKGPFPAVLIIHGGGWIAGDKRGGREKQTGAILARAGFTCASINYFLKCKVASQKWLPGWPQNVYDCKLALRFLNKYADEYKISKGNIGVIGGSAGGHLAMLIGLTSGNKKLEPEAPYKGYSTAVKAIVDLYGIPDISKPIAGSNGNPCGRNWTHHRLANNPELFKLLSPITHVTQSSPPIFILHGSGDKVVPLAYSEDLLALLKEKGARYQYKRIDNAPHSFPINSSQWGDYSKEVIDFFKKYLK